LIAGISVEVAPISGAHFDLAGVVGRIRLGGLAATAPPSCTAMAR